MKDGYSYVCRLLRNILKDDFYVVVRTSAKEVMQQLASVCLTDSKITGKIINRF